MTETKQKKQRDVSLDIAKGILIFLVVWGHAIQMGFGYGYGESGLYMRNAIYRGIYSFHMPLFMAISGYLFYYSNKKPFGKVISSKLKSIGIPYLVYCTIMVLILVPTTQMGGIKYMIWETYANGFWFLTSVLLNCFVVASISLLSKNRWMITTLLLLIDFGLFFVDENYLYKTHNFMFTCFIIGYLYNMYCRRPLICNKTRWFGVAIACVALPVCVSFFQDELYIYTSGVCIIRDGSISFDQLKTDVSRSVIALVASICFLYFVPLGRYLSAKCKNVLCSLSRYSLGIYCLTSIMLSVQYKALGKLGIDIPYSYIYPIALTLVIMTCSYYFFRYCEKRRILNALFLGGR